MRDLRPSTSQESSGHAKGAGKGSCGETVVQKGVFGESVSSLPPQVFQDLSGVLRANLKGAEKKRTLQKHPFGQPFLRTTPSPLLWRALKSRSKKINANYFCTKFFNNPSGHGRPRRKSWMSARKNAFFCGPGDGEKLFDPWASGRKGQECPREIRTKKFMFMLFLVP